LWSTELKSFVEYGAGSLVDDGARIVSGIQSWKLLEVKLLTLHNSDAKLKWELSEFYGNYLY